MPQTGRFPQDVTGRWPHHALPDTPKRCLQLSPHVSGPPTDLGAAEAGLYREACPEPPAGFALLMLGLCASTHKLPSHRWACRVGLKYVEMLAKAHYMTCASCADDVHMHDSPCFPACSCCESSLSVGLSVRAHLVNTTGLNTCSWVWD